MPQSLSEGAVLLEWNMLDDRLTLAGQPAWRERSPLGSTGASFAALLGQGGSERSIAIREAVDHGGDFEAQYVVQARSSPRLVQERGRVLNGPDGRPALVRSALRTLETMQAGSAGAPAPAHGRGAFLDALPRLLLDAGRTGLALILIEARLSLPPSDREFTSVLRSILRQGDLFARFDDTSVIFALRGAGQEQAEAAARRICASWKVLHADARLSVSTIIAPKYGFAAPLLIQRLLETRELARLSCADVIVGYSTELAARDASLRRIALGDDLVLALNARQFRLGFAPVYDARSGCVVFEQARSEIDCVSGAMTLCDRRPLFARLDAAPLIDTRAVELALHRAATTRACVAVRLSATTADEGWLDALQAAAVRSSELTRNVIVELDDAETRSADSAAEDVAARLRNMGCGVMASSSRQGARHADYVRLDPLAMGRLDLSPDDRADMRALIQDLQDQGRRVIVPAEASEDARIFCRSCGADLVEGPAREQTDQPERETQKFSAVA